MPEGAATYVRVSTDGERLLVAQQLPFCITEIVPDGPAGMDGQIRVGDVILQVDGEDVSPLTEEHLAKRIRGTPASQVRLTLSRAEFVPDEGRQRSALKPTSRESEATTSVFDIEIVRGAPAPDGALTSCSLDGLHAQLTYLTHSIPLFRWWWLRTVRVEY